MIGLLLWLWSLMDLGWVGLAGVAAVGALLIWEHSLVSADDLSKVDAAFFTVNGYVSVLFFLFWAADATLL
jgi:4-hydroxybenzoate polyprenyltransferase